MAGHILKTGKVITKTAEKITLNANNGDIIFNAAKSVKYSAKKDIIYDSYVVSEAEQTENLLVTKVISDVTEVEIGKTYTFKAVQFSRKPKAGGKELEKVKWAYQLDDEGIKNFPKQGNVLGNTVIKKVTISDEVWDNKKVKIYAYIQKAADDVSVECNVKFNPIELLLLFYVDEWDSGTKMFKEAAQTRLQNIKNSNWYDPSIHKVHCPPIQAIDEIIEIVPKYYTMYGGKGKVVMREMGVFSHSGKDGPISYDTKIKMYPYNHKCVQMKIEGWGLIDLVWVKKDASCVFYGCNSGSEKPNKNGKIKTFSKNISLLPNFKEVAVWGQSSSSFPSFFPDYRVTSAARSTPGIGGIGWDVGETYMVSGNKGEGKKSIHLGFRADLEREKEELKKHPKANNMNCYKNGTKIKSTHQGKFNEHRKTTVTTN